MNQMKKILTKCIIALSIIFTGCIKDQSLNISTLNSPLVIPTSTQFDIRASDVITTKSLVIRKIEYIDKNTKQILDTFLIKMEEIDATENILLKLRNRTFKGTLTISSDNQIVYEVKIDKGGIQKNNISNTSNEVIISNMVPTCKFNLIHGCVSHAIDSMGIFEYGVCLYSAPECYALLWAGCAFNYCVTGEQK